MVTAYAVPAVGDGVDVSWGVEIVRGRVMGVSRTGSRTHLTVEVPILGPQGESLEFTTITIPWRAEGE